MHLNPKDEPERYNPFDAYTQEYEKEMNKRNAKKIFVEASLAVFIAVFSLLVFKYTGLNNQETISVSIRSTQISGSISNLISLILALGSWKKYHCWYSPQHPFTS